MKIPDILAAGWSASFSGTDVVIEMTKLSKPGAHRHSQLLAGHVQASLIS